MRKILAGALALLCLGADAAPAESPAADLYFHGLAEVEATLPRSDLTMPSSAMPCVNCHGADGRGGREGGVAVPPISRRHLAMATAERPAYNQALLTRALRDGIGADGAALHAIMPRYALADALALEVWDWLEAIGPAHKPGVSDDAIWIAVPSADTGDPRAAVVAGVLRLHAERLNQHGGIYGRMLRLIDGETDQAFARLAAVEPGTQTESTALDLWPLHAAAAGKPDFPLIPADSRLIQNLLEAAKQADPKARRLSEIGDDSGPLPQTLVFDGRAEHLSAFVRAWKGPAALTIYTTTAHIDLAALQSLPPRPLQLVLANPFVPGETSDSETMTAQLADFETAAVELGLAKPALPFARAAWVAASMLEDALRATGRALDQERFKAALTSMPPFESGLLPPVHPTRGLTSIGLVTFDLSTHEIRRTALAMD